jgi:hypothetical protein
LRAIDQRRDMQARHPRGNGPVTPRRILAAAGVVLVAATGLAACGGGAAQDSGATRTERINTIAHEMYDLGQDVKEQVDGKEGFDALEELGEKGLATMLDKVGDLYDKAAKVDPLYEPCAAGSHEAAAALRTVGFMGLMSLGDKFETAMDRCEADMKAVSGLEMDGALGD